MKPCVCCIVYMLILLCAADTSPAECKNKLRRTSRHLRVDTTKVKKRPRWVTRPEGQGSRHIEGGAKEQSPALMALRVRLLVSWKAVWAYTFISMLIIDMQFYDGLRC